MWAGQPWGPVVRTSEVREATHCSATTYCSGRGMHCTPATCTPWAISEKSRPRFTPRMVTLVPPSGGPDTVRIWRETKHREVELVLPQHPCFSNAVPGVEIDFGFAGCSGRLNVPPPPASAARLRPVPPSHAPLDVLEKSKDAEIRQCCASRGH